MKKIGSLCLILFLLTAGLLFASGGAEKGAETKPVVLKFADNAADGHPSILADTYFAELVEKRTNGRIKVTVYHSGQLGDEKSTIEQVSFGGIDLVRTSLSPLTQFNSELNALMLPFLYSSREHYFKVIDGEIGDYFRSSLKDKDLYGICWYETGSRGFYNSKRPIRKVADMKGLKIRVQQSEMMIALVEALGASPTPMSFGEVYNALQTGVIDGAENNWPSYDATGHYEVAKYYTRDDHNRIPEIVLINLKRFESFSKEDQGIIMQAAAEAAKAQQKFWGERVEASKKKVMAAGNEVIELTPVEKAEFQKAVMPLYEKFASDHMDIVKKILAAAK
ncbi:MAG TPA: TRAP transporter substrate-binding protein [Spirochaetia bacterium]|nr:TRAP transporter substrate-binding protein [Spirochaetia bacterium]